MYIITDQNTFKLKSYWFGLFIYFSAVNDITKEKIEIIEHGIKEPAVVLVCGDGMSGQLGLGEEVSEKPRPALVPDVKNIIDVVAGGMHTVCLDANRKVCSFDSVVIYS